MPEDSSERRQYFNVLESNPYLFTLRLNCKLIASTCWRPKSSQFARGSLEVVEQKFNGCVKQTSLLLGLLCKRLNIRNLSQAAGHLEHSIEWNPFDIPIT